MTSFSAAEIAFTIAVVLIAIFSTIRCVHLLWNWSRAASFTAKSLSLISFLISLLELVRCIDMHGTRGVFDYTVSSVFTDNVTLLISIGGSLALTQFLSTSARSFWRLGLLNPQLNRRRAVIKKLLISEHVILALTINTVGIVLTQLNHSYIKSVVFWAFFINFSVVVACLYFAASTLIETTKRYITLLLHPPAAGVAISSQQNQQLLNSKDPVVNMDTVTYLNYIMNYDHHPQVQPLTASYGHTMSFFPPTEVSLSDSTEHSLPPSSISSNTPSASLFSSQNIHNFDQPYVQLDSKDVSYVGGPHTASARNSPQLRPNDPPATIGLDLGDGSIVSVIVDNRPAASSRAMQPQSYAEPYQHHQPHRLSNPIAPTVDYNHTISHTTHLLQSNPFYMDNEIMFNRDANFTTVAGQSKPTPTTSSPSQLSLSLSLSMPLQFQPPTNIPSPPPPPPSQPYALQSKLPRNSKVATIDTFYPNELELELKENLSADLQRYYDQWRANIREVVMFSGLSMFIGALAICALFFFAIQASRSSEPISSTGSFFEDDFLSWVQLAAVLTMLYLSVSHSAVSSSLDWNDQHFLASALGKPTTNTAPAQSTGQHYFGLQTLPQYR